MKKLMLSFALLSLCAAAWAAQGPLDVSDIVGQQQRIRAEIEAGTGPYGSLPAARKDELLARQASLLAMLAGKRTTAELSEDERAVAFDTLEWIESAAPSGQNAVAKENADDRMVCERRQILGSNRKERVCMTAGQMKLQRERAQERLQTSGGDLTR